MRNRPRETSAIATAPRGNATLRGVGFGIALAVAPPAIGGIVAAIARSRRAGLVAGGAAALALGLARWQLARVLVDEPDFDVEERIGGLEIRRYDARVVAETFVSEADFRTALARGFERLARYIAGDNEHHEKLAMTAPVTGKLVDGEVCVAFAMPACRTAATLPAPADDRVEIVEIPPRRVAVLPFRGPRRAALIEDKQAELRRLVEEAGYRTRGEPAYAGFDPPWTLPLLRRNEVWIELA